MSEPAPGMAVTKGVTLVRHLGAGAMGSVWLADHAALQTKVVVKFMARELLSDDSSVARFSQEAAAASQVKSPHVVQMLDHGRTEDGQPFIIMEHLLGQDLGTYLTIVGRVEPRIALSIVTQTARALSRAHEVGVIHRDIKPDNLFLADTGDGDGDVFVKVLDFGVARAASLSSGRITTTGNVVGTPCYMSPEQINGARDVDSRADIWALAVVTFEMLTGVVPFAADSAAGIAIAIGKGTVPPLTALAPQLPGAVDDWFRKACRRDPSQRFASARELATELGAALATTVDAPALRGSNRSQIVPRGAVTSGPFDVTQADTQVGSLEDNKATMPDLPPVTQPLPMLLDSVGATVSERSPTLVMRPKPKSRAALLAIAASLAAAFAVLFFVVTRRVGPTPAPPVVATGLPAPAPEPEPERPDAALAPGVPEPAPILPPTVPKPPHPGHPKPTVTKRPAPASTYEDIQ